MTWGFDKRTVLTTRLIVLWAVGLLALAAVATTALWLGLGPTGRIRRCG